MREGCSGLTLSGAFIPTLKGGFGAVEWVNKKRDSLEGITRQTRPCLLTNPHSCYRLGEKVERWEKKMDTITPRPRRTSVLLLVIPLTLLLIFGCTVQVHDRPTNPIPPEVPSRKDGSGYKSEHVFIVVMDGVRYSETFGDPTHRFIPHLYHDLRPQGTLFTHYHNRGVTVTRQGHSTLISGTWQTVPNGGPRLTRPTLFEYYRADKRTPPTKSWSVFAKGPYA